MFSRTLVTSIGALAGIIFCSLAAQAQVSFEGLTPGTLEVGSTLNILRSATPATLRVQSGTPVNVTVSPPQLVSGASPDPANTARVGILKAGTVEVSSNAGGGSVPLPLGQTDLVVDMEIQRPGNFQPGTYAYSILLTVVP